MLSLLVELITFICAIELKSRQAWAKRIKSLSSKQARIFLEEILREISYPIHTIQTDNGSEFKKYFDQAINNLKDTEHIWSFPRNPKANGYVERFNWTVQDEFINYEIDLAENYPQEFDCKLEKWLEFYNNIRPHQSLDYKTPQQAVQLLTS
ncbi:MAG: putative transposase [Microgenomates bacterium 39_7]|nr:MAG: putative transposase [Microgenomates bacterium 39_7]